MNLKKSKFARFLYILAITIIVTALILYSLRQQILRFSSNYIVKILNNENFSIEVNDPAFDKSQVKIKKLNLTFKKNLFFFPIALSELNIKPIYSQILFNSEFVATVKGKAYEGNLDLNIDHQINTNRSIIGGTINKLQLGKHEQIAALGLASGFLSTNIKELIIANRLEQIQANLILKNLSFPEARTISHRLTGLPFTLEIPAFRISSAQADFVSDEHKLLVQNIKIKSSFASITGELELTNTNSGAELNLGQFDLILSKLGKLKYGTIIAGFAQPKIDTNTYRIIISEGFRKFSILSINKP